MVHRAVQPSRGLARAGLGDTLSVLAAVVVPTLAKGVLIRRPAMVALAARLALDARAVRVLQRLRRLHGDGPLLLPVPGRPQLVLLAAEHVHRVLVAEAALFAPSTREKRAALAHFEPRTSLISRPPERAPRRRFNDEVLESARPVHSMAETIQSVMEGETAALLARAGARLRWEDFTHAWHRAARRVILGDAAGGDDALTDALARLRRAGNWAFLHPVRRKLRRRFHDRLAAHLARAEPGSIAARIAGRRDDAVDQVAQWLFAMDAAAIATYRALALIAAAGVAERVRAEGGAGVADERPFTRACLLEAVRLWPTTPAILRETTAPTAWDGGTVPAGTPVLIFTPFFHRDGEHLPEADRFAPELWLHPQGRRGWPLVPFSDGPTACPGQNLVLLMAGAAIATLLRRHEVRLEQAGLLDAGRPLPGTLDHVAMTFALSQPRADRPIRRQAPTPPPC